VAQIQDEGFHEIQLNGKQLVFLFMAATVVSVVIFLCGVLVGRGVRAERAASTDASSNTATDVAVPSQSAPPTTTPPGSDPTAAAAPAPAADDLSYFRRLEKPGKSADQLKSTEKSTATKSAAESPTARVERPPARVEPAPARVEPAPARIESTAAKATEKPAPATAAAAAPVPPPPAPPPSTQDEPRASSEPAGQGFAVQIAALNVRSEAEAIAKRLSSKGYSAYVLAPASGTPSVFRVRVGKFSTRREAESVAAKLQKEEQLKPWVTR
jgi:DedD protein